MRKSSVFISITILTIGQAWATDEREAPHQFPPVNQVATTNNNNGQGATYTPQYQMLPHYYPQQAMVQPMYYGHPVNNIHPGVPAYYFPQTQVNSGQPSAIFHRYLPGYPYPAAQARTHQGEVQQPGGQVPQPQYRSPYNPNIAATPGPKPPPPAQPKKEVKPWGDTRYIWPDFYTDFTGDFWDEMINAPYQMGYMPGGWRFPSLSSPDPVTVGDAVANQVPPILDESANFMNFSN